VSDTEQTPDPDKTGEPDKPRVVITYCRQCQWLLRAAWMAQELLSTFAEDLGEVALRPGTGGYSGSNIRASSSGSASATAASPTSRN
jgi:hypothetical protein